jgi:molybdenum cofactor cytidylyltransferase
MVELPVGAVVLAAGQSKRMGRPKMVLSWGGGTVVEQVVDTLLGCDVQPVIVVTGGASGQVVDALRQRPVIFAHNVDYATAEMLESLKIGLRMMPDDVGAALIALGDQPQIQPAVVSGIIHQFKAKNSRLIVPSYQMRRGHPWLIRRDLWEGILRMGANESMRTFLSKMASEIDYFIVDTPSIFADLDTPEDYKRYRTLSSTD